MPISTRIAVHPRPRHAWLLAVAALLAACGQQNPPAAGPDEPAVDAITVHDGWVRKPPPAASVAGAYFGIENAGPVDDRLLAVATDAAAHVEIHEMRSEDGMMRMRELPDGLPLPAGTRTDLEPGGSHLMLIDPATALEAGDIVGVTLRFAHAPDLTVELTVRDMNRNHDAHGGGGHPHGEAGHSDQDDGR